jgi:hypothetical protein
MSRRLVQLLSRSHLKKLVVTITNFGKLLAAGLLAGLTWTSQSPAQAYTPPPPKLVPGPCVPTKEYPCDPPTPKPPPAPAADQFPFPGENPGAMPTAAPAQQTAPASAPGAKEAAPAPSPSNRFPFPGEPAETPSAPAPASGQKSAFPFPGEPPESSSSSSSSSDDPAPSDAAPDPVSGGQPPLKDAGSTGSTRFQRKHLAKVEDLDHRELEDIDVSHYYYTTGNYLAAYMRAQDAVKLYPDDENAHFALGAAAEKLGKKDEAIAEYQTYLKLAPDGTKAKQVTRSLETLRPK